MLKEKRDLLGQKKEARQAIYNKVVAENRARTPEETIQYDALGVEIKALEDEVRFLEIGEQEARAAATVPLTGANAVNVGVGGNTHNSTGDQRAAAGFNLGRVFKRMRQGYSPEGVDAEVIQAGFAEARSTGQSPEGNLVLPYALFCVNPEGRDLVAESLERRDMSATGTTSTTGDQGGQLITTTIGRLYEALFNRLILRGMGATFMPNMVGNYTMPRVVKGTAPGWKAENAAADETSPTIASSVLQPQRLPTYIEVSNQLFLQSDANLSNVLQRYLVNQLSEIFEAAQINGAGHGSNQPLGILNTSGIGAVYAGNAPLSTTNANGAALVYEDVVNLYTKIAASNADFGSMGYVINPLTVGKLQTTLVGTNTAAKYILGEGAKSLNAFQVGISGNVPSNLTKGSSTGILSAVLFGNFADLVIATWGGLDIMVNPYSLDTQGLTRINAALYGDSGVARPESFAAIKDAKLS